jgi:glyoxylase-like metal-dependent hydrolase (beta-lactamase superfamily II)
MARKAALGALLVAAIAVGALLRGFSAAPLPAPAPFAGPLPPATPPAEMEIAALSTGVTHRSAAFGYRGGSFRDRRAFAMAALLVKHPRGDLLIDTGFGHDVDAQFRLMPWPFRAATRYERARSAAEQLDAAGYDRGRLRGVVLTHAHWDHVSGIADLGDVPVWVTAEERGFIHDGGALTAVARSIAGARWEEYAFEGGAYLGFPRSHDVYGDGAVVVVPAPGHTPGSVIVFLALPTGRRLALVGDLVWQREGIALREERPWPMRALADGDPAGVRENILRMAALAARFPELEIVPAHDARAFAALPGL